MSVILRSTVTANGLLLLTLNELEVSEPGLPGDCALDVEVDPKTVKVPPGTTITNGVCALPSVRVPIPGAVSAVVVGEYGPGIATPDAVSSSAVTGLFPPPPAEVMSACSSRVSAA